MSLTVRILKVISIVSYLGIPSLNENGFPFFAVLLIFLFQFLNDVFTNPIDIFWEGLITIPIIAAIIVFLRNKRYKILLCSFTFLFIALLYITDVTSNSNHHRIDFWFIAISILFIISSLAVVILTKNKSKDQSEF